jgi:hypothetical protein
MTSLSIEKLIFGRYQCSKFPGCCARTLLRDATQQCLRMVFTCAFKLQMELDDANRMSESQHLVLQNRLLRSKNLL